MQRLQLITTIFLSAVLFVACSDNSAANAGKVKDSTSSSTTSDGASFSCKLDGKTISGRGTDENINAAFHLTGDDKGQIFFRLSDMNNIGDKFQFQVPGKTGSTTFSVTPTYSYAGYATSNFATYLDNPLTVTVNSITSSRISGIFSGTYTLQKGSGDANTKQTIEVTDGKFDIPFSTSAQWKQLYHAE